jgi:SAM-dependent methyltransferase
MSSADAIRSRPKSAPEIATSLSRQADHNRSEWSAGKHVADYSVQILSPVEVKVLVRYRDAIVDRRVLELGCGAGRILRYLVMLGADAHGVDLAAAMVEYCRIAVPEATVSVGDVLDLRASVEGRFDTVIAPDNLIDVFADEERRRVLTQIREIIAPEGLLIFSTHDLGWMDDPTSTPRPSDPYAPTHPFRRLLDKSPAALVRAVRRRQITAINRRRLGPLQERHADYAIVNDFPHEYSLLHYYITRDAQERQLAATGWTLVECLDTDGRLVAPGGHGVADTLLYVARPTRAADER